MATRTILTPILLKNGNPNQGVLSLHESIRGSHIISEFTTSYSNYTIFTGLNDVLPIQTYGNVTLTEGVYDGTTLAAALETAINLLTSGSGFTVPVTFNTSTLKFTFTPTNSSTLVFLFGSVRNSMYRVLGYNRETTSVASGTSSLRVADFTPLDALFLELHDTKQYHGQTYQNEALVKSLVIPWVSPDGSKVYWKGKCPLELGMRNLSEIQFKFTDEKNNTVSFLGGWVLTLLQK